MTNWKHGYFGDAGYIFGHQAETMPAWLQWAALIQGHVLPRKGFRYLDAGCGQGLNLLLAAAANPDSEFVGVDFMPEHIAHARQLAAQCKLSNVSFIEGDFVELARDPRPLGMFDYAVCHGITTWIAPTVKAALFEWIGQSLQPGGIFYNSYNTYPGWLSTVPFQHLVLLQQRSKSGAQALSAAQQLMAQLQAAGSPLFEALPKLSPRLEGLKKSDPAYLVQEYNNQSWQPVFVSQMIEAMAAVKLSYLGTATLTEARNLIPSAERQALVDSEPDPILREQLRDLAVNQLFRRDLYVKGQRRPWRPQQAQHLAEFRFVRNPTKARPEPGAPYPITGGVIEIDGNAEFYGAMLDIVEACGAQGYSAGADLARGTDEQRSILLTVMSLLLHAGYVELRMGDDQGAGVQTGMRTNRVLAQHAVQGAPYRYAVLPLAAAAHSMSDADMMMLHYQFECVAASQWTERLGADLLAAGSKSVQPGEALGDAATRPQLINDLVQTFRDIKLPYLISMKAVPTHL